MVFPTLEIFIRLMVSGTSHGSMTDANQLLPVLPLALMMLSCACLHGDPNIHWGT